MKVALGRRGDYAVRAVLDMARHWGKGRRKAREIAQAMDVPERYVPEILGSLVRTGLVEATAGPNGGYELTRAPRDITLLEVVETAEGPLATGQCLLRGGPCDWENVCPLHEPWTRAQQALSDELQRTTYAELVDADTRITTQRAKRDGDPEPTAVLGE